jgi:hypothetical protein
VFILDQGLSKLRADEQTAKSLHTVAAEAYPVLSRIDSKVFVKFLGTGETVLGSALLLPLVPAGMAGTGLIGFSSALLGMWWRTPGMHEPRSPKPTPKGIPVAKDAWMFAIGAALVIDSLASRKPKAR